MGFSLFVFHSFFFHVNIIKGFMMTAFREEELKGCLMWTSRIWSFLTQEGDHLFLVSNDEGARGNGFY